MNSVKNERDMLVEALQKELVPVLENFGFKHSPLPAADRKSKEISFAFPLGRFRRERNGDVELIEVQLDKHGSPKFRLNFGVIPANGILAYDGKTVERDDACVHYLPLYCELCSSPKFMKWFSVSRLMFFQSVDSRINQLVKTVSGYSQEVDDWFNGKGTGPHVRIIDKRNWGTLPKGDE